MSHRTFKLNLTHNTTTITCPSSCCVPKVSQINGAQGEATNTDDLPARNMSVDKRQNVRLTRLENKLSQLTVVKKNALRKKKRRGINNNRPNWKRMGGPFPGITDNSPMDIQPAVVHKDPTVLSAVAQLAPFRVPRGVVNILQESQPSQKFTSRCLLSLSPAVSSETILAICPCIASNAAAASLMAFTGTRTNLSSQLLQQITYSSGVTGISASTNTPYTDTVLSGNDYSWRCVSAGLRIRNTTAAVNRQGVVKWFVDYKGTLAPYTESTLSYGTIAANIDASHRTVRRNMATHPEADVVISGQLFNTQWKQAGTGSSLTNDGTYWPLVNNGQLSYLGNTPNIMAVGAAFVLFPAVSAAQTYDLEFIEHWEVTGSPIETLHTPSGAHSLSADTLHSIVSQAHHQHALTPSMALHDVAKGISFAEHHKAALKDAASVAAAIALL